MKKLILLASILGFSIIIFQINLNSKSPNQLSHNEQIRPSLISDSEPLWLCMDSSKHFEIDDSLPMEVDFNKGFGYNSKLFAADQKAFDIFSWQTFVALNHGVDNQGKTVSSNTENSQYNRVWEKWITADDLMKETKDNVLQLEASNRQKVLYSISKISDDDELNDFLMIHRKPLIDKNGNFVMYEQKINPTEAAFVKDNKLTTQAGIINYVKNSKNNKLLLPPNDIKSDNSIEIKAAWRIMEEGDDASRYYTKKATIAIDSKYVDGQKKDLVVTETVGLVGMHIITKTGEFNEWIWSTFEHVDNAPDNIQKAQSEQSRQWSFYDPRCLNCPVNEPPVTKDKVDGKAAYLWNSEKPYAKKYLIDPPNQKVNPATDKFGTQVTRVYPIYYCTDEINYLWQRDLKATKHMGVFANYRLIGSQWELFAKDVPDTTIAVGNVAPLKLANLIAETYVQPNSSCLGCHKNHANFTYVDERKDTITIKTDFSFVLAGAN